VILADTSAWVEFDRGTGTPADRALTMLVAQGGPLAVTGPVVMGVLAGARSDSRAAELRRLFYSFALIPVDPVADFEAAAAVSRACRRSGTTPRGLLDCLIASVAWRAGASLLTTDADLERVTAVVGIDLHPLPTGSGPTCPLPTR